jgi:hypothetical protein
VPAPGSVMPPDSTKERPYVGQVRFGIRDSWVDVSDGPTFKQAAAGATAAYGETRDAGGRLPLAVRVIRIDTRR